MTSPALGTGRSDATVQPTMFRCAIVGDAELHALRRIKHVVRLGRVRAIDPDRIVLERAEVATSSDHQHVHCSAAGLPHGPAQSVFHGSRIVPQYVRRCSPTFSAAFIAHVEASFDDGEEKSALCQAVPVPEEPADWIRMHLQTAHNQQQWAQHPQLRDWLRRSRLEAYGAMFEKATRQGDAHWLALQVRLHDAKAPGLRRMAELIGSASRKRAGERMCSSPAG